MMSGDMDVGVDGTFQKRALGIPAQNASPEATRGSELATIGEPKSLMREAFHVDPKFHAFSVGRENRSESTPGVSSDVDNRLIITSSSNEDEDGDSLADYASSKSDEDGPAIFRAQISALPTGLCYDDRMRYHAEVASMSESNLHPEDPRRIYYIFKELSEAGLVADPKIKRPLVHQPLLRIDAREATEDECCLVHTLEHYQFVKSTQDKTDEELINLSESPLMDSIYFNRLTFFSSKLSVGGAIESCRAVVSRKVKNAIAVIRPPGHHAETNKTMGFCLFNNVCIASRVCQNAFGEACRKILILDWDVHHGNGGQEAFYEDPNILYISIHVHMDGKFYPAGDEGDKYHCGAGAGLGRNVNIPWPTKGMGDSDYIFAFQQVVMPIAYEFDPDFVIIAAGFDAAAGDELGGCFVTPACYAHMTHMLMNLANGKVAVCLEGGYNFKSISKSALAVTRTLMGEPPDRLPPTAATMSAVTTVQEVKRVQSRYWRSLYPKEPVGGIFGNESFHDLIREYQAATLYNRFKLTELYIFRDGISKSFKNEVLASPFFEEKRNLLIIFHDPPEAQGVPDPSTGRIDLQRTFLVDKAKVYIQWALDKGFGVLDVNIPEHITDPDLPDSLDSPADTDPEVIRKEAEKLAIYLWENYVEPNGHDQIFFVGVGNAFHGLVRLLTDKEEVYHKVGGVIAFIAKNPVRPVHSPDNDYLSKWYVQNSLVYVARNHSLWSLERKKSKRYGNLIKADDLLLNNMMVTHKDEVFAFIEKRLESDKDEDMTEDDLEAQGDVVMKSLEQ